MYYETPEERLGSKDEIREEWRGVKDQEDIELETKVFCNEGNKYTVQWSLSYTENGEENNLNGIYLIKLGSEGKCTEFWQYCQLE